METTSTTNLLEVHDLTIKYGSQVAVGGITFDVRPGEIFGLLGPNGAGKTSSLSAIEGLLKPDAGSVRVAGFDIFTEPLRARANMGIQLQSTSFQQDLTVFEIFELYASLYGVELSKEQVDSFLTDIKLEEARSKRVGQLSGGQQQRLSLSIATIHNPPLVLLDEPTSGLDPQSRRQLWERIEKMRDEGRSVLITTHSMEEARAICDRVAIMDHGRIIIIDNPIDLVEKFKNDEDIKALARRGEVTLEDVFIGLTGRAVRS